MYVCLVGLGGLQTSVQRLRIAWPVAAVYQRTFDLNLMARLLVLWFQACGGCRWRRTKQKDERKTSRQREDGQTSEPARRPIACPPVGREELLFHPLIFTLFYEKS